MTMTDYDDAVTGVDYRAATSVADAVELLKGSGGEGKLIAGGQSLLVLKRMGLVAPSVLISLDRVDELRHMEPLPDGGVRIGAMVTQDEVERSADLGARYTALAEAASMVASPPVRHRGTIGGNICHADPTGDPPAALIAFDAELEIVGPGGMRTLGIESFFVDFMEVALSEDEVLTAIRLPGLPTGTGSAYLKHRVRGVDTALVGVAAMLTLDMGGHIADARIGIVGAAPTPFRATDAEPHLIGSNGDEAAVGRAAAAAAAQSDPFSDTEATEWYRREMVDRFVHRTIGVALERARANQGGS